MPRQYRLTSRAITIAERPPERMSAETKSHNITAHRRHKKGIMPESFITQLPVCERVLVRQRDLRCAPFWEYNPRFTRQFIGQNDPAEKSRCTRVHRDNSVKSPGNDYKELYHHYRQYCY
ncbi:MAG: hypothetical protein ACE5IC_06015 [Candidatus Brocadiales bacterium]